MGLAGHFEDPMVEHFGAKTICLLKHEACIDSWLKSSSRSRKVETLDSCAIEICRISTFRGAIPGRHWKPQDGVKK